jgi:hypothetical protein
MIKGDVLIVVPNMGWIRNDLSDHLTYWLVERGVKSFRPENLKPPAYARNFCIDKFLETEFQYLWFIDHDTCPPIHALDFLRNAERSVISGIVRTRKYDWDGSEKKVGVVARKTERGYKPCGGSGIEKIDVCGAACLMIHRSVFEKIEPPWFVDPPWPKPGEVRSHDFFFCEKLQEAGVDLYAHFSVVCKHKKEEDM